MKRASIVFASLVLAACAASGTDPGTTTGPGTGKDSGGVNDDTSGFDVVGKDGTTTDSGSTTDTIGTDTGGGVDTGPIADAGPTFGSTCPGGKAPQVKGTVFAPNGTDPVPTAEVYAPTVVNPFKPGVACDTCDKPIDSYYSFVHAAADGTFTLDLSSVPSGPTVKMAVRKGRFRKVSTISVSCGTTTTMTAAQTTLPGTAPTGEDSMPKIAVGSGNSDHLDTILTALGISTFDCYEGRKTTTSENCPAAEATHARVSTLLLDAAKMATYNLLFISCAPGIWASYTAADQSSIAANLKSWVDRGGRLIVTDNSYDYVSQSWPTDVTWQGPAGSPWAIAGANVGNVPSGGTSSATVDDAALVAWLKVVGVTGAPTVSIGGWLHNWSVVSSIPTTSKEISHGSVSYTYPTTGSPTTADLPLNLEFIKNKCGRVIYSSYHTLSSVSSSSLSAQEKILEYLILDVAACLRTV